MAVCTAAGAQPAAAPTVVEVQAGDTFSGIVERLVGPAQGWTSLYDARRSGLSDPNRIHPGMRLELVAADNGRSYLRLLRGAQTRLAAAEVPAPSAPPALRAAILAPAPAAAPPRAAPMSPPAPALAQAPPPAASPVPVPPSAAVPPDAGPDAAGADTLVIGLLPNIGTTALMAQYEHLKAYLERLGPQKVRIVVPANFKAFFDSTMRGDYDLAVAAPHFARVAQVDSRMVPLAMYEPRLSAQFITSIDSSVTGARDVRGKTVAFANPQSLVAMYGQQWLRQMGLEPGKDYEVRGARTDMSVGRMLLSGDVAAAIMSASEFRALPPEESARLKIVEVFARIPNFIVVGHPRLGNQKMARLKSQLMGFPLDKDDGAAFIRATGLTGFVDAEESALRELDPYVAPTRRLMGVGN